MGIQYTKKKQKVTLFRLLSNRLSKTSNRILKECFFKGCIANKKSTVFHIPKVLELKNLP